MGCRIEEEREGVVDSDLKLQLSPYEEVMPSGELEVEKSVPYSDTGLVSSEMSPGDWRS